MNLMTARRSWLLAPILFLICALGLFAVWASVEPDVCVRIFDLDGMSPVELMTLPLFALIVPLAWLCPPVSGGLRRQMFWSADFSILGIAAVSREEDLHKALAHTIWPDLSGVNFNFKMKFFANESVPLSAKLFVIAIYLTVAVAVLAPLCRYGIPLVVDFFRLRPVAWSVAFFGGSAVLSQLADGLEGKLEDFGICCSDSCVALFRVIEEGGEMVMALFALLAILQSHLVFCRGGARG